MSGAPGARSRRRATFERVPHWRHRVVARVRQAPPVRRFFTFPGAVRLELTTRRLLGQPLSARAWTKMTFNDKLTYRRLRDRNRLLALFSDKLAVRDYVAQQLGSHYLVPLLRVGERASSFSDLTGPYVLKANHGSAMVTFVAPGETLSEKQAVVADSWRDDDYAWRLLEWGYRDLPRRLMAEQFLGDTATMTAPTDYKFFAFRGHVAMIKVITGRFTQYREGLYTTRWEPIDGSFGPYAAPRVIMPEPPRHLDEMMRVAIALSREIDFVRVDLYEASDRVLVGELSPYPGGGLDQFEPADLDRWLGDFWREPPVRARR